MTTPEIEELKSLVEQKYGKILATTTDFEEFSLYLEKKASGTISPSTLKRLYGYVSDNHKPRMVTLVCFPNISVIGTTWNLPIGSRQAPSTTVPSSRQTSW